MKLLLLVGLFLACTCQAETSYRKMLFDTCRFYNAIRTEQGFYLDSYMVSSRRQKHNFNVSSASTGIGLISLCVADNCGFYKKSEEKIIQTLNTLNGDGEIKPERNANGLFRHFIDSRTGKAVGRSKYSTIDTAILMAGAIFCKNTFPENKTIGEATDKLWNSIDWESCKIDDMRYYLTQDDDGAGSGITRMFNEYIILADYCAISSGSKPPEINSRWSRHKSGKHAVLSDTPNKSLPLFVFQFSLYLSPVRSNSKAFYKECIIAAEADRDWWFRETKTRGVWGSSAGSGFKGYVVCSTGKNDDLIVHAPSMIAFAPLSARYRTDIKQLLTKYPELMQGSEKWKVPWRISLKDKDWTPPSIQGIDLAPLLFGLTTMDKHTGFNFFRKNSKYTPEI